MNLVGGVVGLYVGQQSGYWYWTKQGVSGHRWDVNFRFNSFNSALGLAQYFGCGFFAGPAVRRDAEFILQLPQVFDARLRSPPYLFLRDSIANENDCQ